MVSALLAKVAKSVVGVDISHEAVEYASQEYNTYENLKFLIGSCESLPLSDNSVDVVTSFETIEHHDKHKQMMQEIKRVLKPDGILIISSPNRLSYSDERNYSNPFHIKELYYEELVDLLKSFFSNIQIYGQKIATGSFVFPLKDSEEDLFQAYTGGTKEVKKQVCSLQSPFYFIAVCSDSINNIRSAVNSIYIDNEDNLLQTLEFLWNQRVEQTQQRLQLRVEEIQKELSSLQSQLQQKETQLEESESIFQQRQTQLESSRSQLQQIKARLELSEEKFQKTKAELEQSKSELQQTREKLIASQDKIKTVESSNFWKLRTAWFKLKRLARIKEGD